MKQISTTIALILFVIGAFYLMASGQETKVITTYPPKTMPFKPKDDTLKIPALSILISHADFQKMADTSWLIMQDYGIEKSGTQIRANQEIMSRQWQRLFFKYAKPDTIRVVKGGKP